MRFATVIDVGVAFGSPQLYKSFPKAKFYLVEPVPTCKPLLDKLVNEMNAEAFNVAAGAEDGVMEFFVHPDTSGSSALRQWEGEAMDGTMHQIPVRRLDSLITGTLARPSLLKVDTQGFEIPVFEGASGILDQIDVIISECSLHQFRKGAPEIFDIMKKMDELGFICYEVLEGHYRPVDNALAQVDLAFVKKDSPLRAEKGVFSAAQVESYLKSHK
jgi:FkbM family methyltransferase